MPMMLQKMNFTYEEVAETIGASRETVTRLLSDFKKEGASRETATRLPSDFKKKRL
jgi:plasmid maintenance system antidote protein VapI